MKDNTVSEKLIIGDRKIKMNESDFIELVTRLDNMADNCPFDGKCIHDCTICWAEKLREFIEN